MFRLQFQMFVMFFLVSCGNKVQSRKAVPSIENTCRISQSSSGESDSLNIAGGDETNEFPSVVNLGGCTGTFISSNIILTAAHCVRENDAIRIRYNGKLYKSSVSVAHPEFDGDFRGRGNIHDVGIVIFDQKISEHTSRIDPFRPADGADIDIIGFGGRGGKTHGKNSIFTESSLPGFRFDTSSYLTIKGSAKNMSEAVSEPGDSGGPMLYQGNIVGVTSGGDSLRNGEDFSIYPSMALLENRVFIDDLVKKHSMDLSLPEPEEAELIDEELNTPETLPVSEWMGGKQVDEVSEYLRSSSLETKMSEKNSEVISDPDRSQNETVPETNLPDSVYIDGEIITLRNNNQGCT